MFTLIHFSQQDKISISRRENVTAQNLDHNSCSMLKPKIL